MVASVPDVMPMYFLSTELIRAFVFGEENRAYPAPTVIRLKIINKMLEFPFTKEKLKSPRVTRAEPDDAIKTGFALSEIFPVTGENNAMIKG